MVSMDGICHSSSEDCNSSSISLAIVMSEVIINETNMIEPENKSENRLTASLSTGSACILQLQRIYFHYHTFSFSVLLFIIFFVEFISFLPMILKYFCIFCPSFLYLLSFGAILVNHSSHPSRLLTLLLTIHCFQFSISA